MRNPRISVVMPVYNATKYLRESLDSVLNQTFKDFELLIINDGSTDDSAAIIQTFKDPRIRFINNSVNSGLTAVRNEGIREARGEYLAWLDADDKSSRRRLELQLEALDRKPEFGICGTWVETFGGQKQHRWRYPTNPDLLRCRLLFDDPFATSSVMLRMRLIREKGLRFHPDFPPAEDYELWERLSEYCKMTNIPKFLTRYREHASQTSVIQKERQTESVWKVQHRQLEKLGINPTLEEKILHQALGKWEFSELKNRSKFVEEWLLKLSEANSISKIFSKAHFMRTISERWFHYCIISTKNPAQCWIKFKSSRASYLSQLDLASFALFFARSLKHWRN